VFTTLCLIPAVLRKPKDIFGKRKIKKNNRREEKKLPKAKVLVLKRKGNLSACSKGEGGNLHPSTRKMSNLGFPQQQREGKTRWRSKEREKQKVIVRSPFFSSRPVHEETRKKGERGKLLRGDAEKGGKEKWRQQPSKKRGT